MLAHDGIGIVSTAVRARARGRGRRRSPCATATLRSSPRRLARFSGLARKRRRKASASSAASSARSGASAPSRGSKAGAAALAALAVPRADVLADVAAEDVAAHAGALLLRDRALQLDRQVADAARRVEDVGRAAARRSDRRRGRRCSCRTCRAAARRAGRSRSVTISPRKNQEPCSGWSRQVFLPQAPRPAAAAKARSTIGPGVHVGARLEGAGLLAPAGRAGARASPSSRRGSRRPRRSARSSPSRAAPAVE